MNGNAFFSRSFPSLFNAFDMDMQEKRKTCVTSPYVYTDKKNDDLQRNLPLKLTLLIWHLIKPYFLHTVYDVFELNLLGVFRLKFKFGKATFLSDAIVAMILQSQI